MTNAGQDLSHTGKRKADGVSLWLGSRGWAGRWPDQVDTMISAAVMSAERYYPAFQLLAWGIELLKRRFKLPLQRPLAARNTLP